MAIEDDLRKVNENLDAFERFNGIPPCNAPGTEQQLAKYLSLSTSQVESLDSETCAEIAYFLSQYSTYIQRISNRETSNLKWIDAKLAEYVCNELKQYDQYTRYEHKVNLIARENDVVRQLLKLKIYTEQIIDRFYFISANIRHMSDMMKNLQVSKR